MRVVVLERVRSRGHFKIYSKVGQAYGFLIGNAYVVDMWTQSGYRRRGIGRALLERLVAPLAGQHVFLFTDDRADFYAACGFRPRGAGLERIDGLWLGRYTPR